MAERPPSKVIYIGSIPFDQTEEQIMGMFCEIFTTFLLESNCLLIDGVSDIAKSIGPVVKLEMMFDKDTGRSKGYAFVEYMGELVFALFCVVFY